MIAQPDRAGIDRIDSFESSPREWANQAEVLLGLVTLGWLGITVASWVGSTVLFALSPPGGDQSSHRDL